MIDKDSHFSQHSNKNKENNDIRKSMEEQILRYN